MHSTIAATRYMVETSFREWRNANTSACRKEERSVASMHDLTGFVKDQRVHIRVDCPLAHPQCARERALARRRRRGRALFRQRARCQAQAHRDDRRGHGGHDPGFKRWLELTGEAPRLIACRWTCGRTAGASPAGSLPLGSTRIPRRMLQGEGTRHHPTTRPRRAAHGADRPSPRRSYEALLKKKKRSPGTSMRAHEAIPAQEEVLIVRKIVGHDNVLAVRRKQLSDVGSPQQNILCHVLHGHVQIPLHEIALG